MVWGSWEWPLATKMAITSLIIDRFSIRNHCGKLRISAILPWSLIQPCERTGAFITQNTVYTFHVHTTRGNVKWVSSIWGFQVSMPIVSWARMHRVPSVHDKTSDCVDKISVHLIGCFDRCIWVAVGITLCPTGARCKGQPKVKPRDLWVTRTGPPVGHNVIPTTTHMTNDVFVEDLLSAIP